MDGRTLFTELKKTLADLYVEPAAAKRIAADAGLDLAQIPFDATAINNWHNILAVAIRSDALPTVLEIALGEYARHQPLVLICETYRSFIAAGGQLDAPQLIEAKTTIFDQQGQQVHHQINIAGDMNVSAYHAAPPRFPKALSAKIPQIAPDKIVGRDADLVDLHQRLCNQRQVVLVNGMGGIGKTTLAQVYIAQYWDEYHHVVWISQTSRDVLNDFVYTEGLLGRLGIRAEGQEVNALFDQIMTTLQTMADQPNLLVIDNAESTLSDLYAYLPAQPQWHILVTSRQYIEKFDLKELDFLGEEAAIELFLRHYTLGKIPREEIKSLVYAVDLHTLTIEILAKTAQSQRTAINQLKQAITEDLRANVYVPHSGKKIDSVTAYLCSIFTVSGLTEPEQWLLKQFICLPAEYHSYDLLEDLINPKISDRTYHSGSALAIYGAWLWILQGISWVWYWFFSKTRSTGRNDDRSQTNDKAALFAETLQALVAMGWLLKNQATDSYKMHRVIADVIKKQEGITVTEVEPLIARVTTRLSMDYSRDNPIDKFVWIPFGQAILVHFPNSTLANMATLQNNLATVLKALGDYAGAKGLLEQALRSDEKNFGPDHPTTAVRYSNLALVLKDLGDYAGAKGLLEQAVTIFEKRLGSSHPYTEVARNNLASLLEQLEENA